MSEGGLRAAHVDLSSADDAAKQKAPYEVTPKSWTPVHAFGGFS